jgi:ATP-dependent DNA ligase
VPVSRSPAFIEPMTAVNVTVLPEGEEWPYQVKLDGYRALLLKHGAHVEIRSRKNQDFTAA